MKRIKLNLLSIGLTVFLALGCTDALDVSPQSELGDSFLKTESGLETVLNGAYASISRDQQTYIYRLFYSTLASQIGYGRAGAYEQTTGIPVGNFTWNSNQPHLTAWWSQYYEGIRNTNIVLDVLAEGGFSEDFARTKSGEAKALRGFLYYQLYQLFGPVPIFVKSKPDELLKSRATNEEMLSLIEQDLLDAAAVLPTSQDEFGRVTKGAALGLLTKFYLNTKQWQKTIDAAREVMDLSIYGLVPEYELIYSHENEGNEEVIWPIPYLSTIRVSHIIGLITPPDYPLMPGHQTFAARTYAYDWFMDTFDPNDSRDDLIVKSYVNTSGVTIQGYGKNQSIWFKYPEDPNAVGADNGIDFQYVRYADVLLSLAEAINEVSGPTQESVDLINLVRDRANATLIQLSDFASKEELRDHLLYERLWELYMEGHERDDLLRHGKFISNAIEHGINAKPHHVLFPIPQLEINANPLILQNDDY